MRGQWGGIGGAAPAHQHHHKEPHARGAKGAAAAGAEAASSSGSSGRTTRPLAEVAFDLGQVPGRGGFVPAWGCPCTARLACSRRPVEELVANLTDAQVGGWVRVGRQCGNACYLMQMAFAVSLVRM